MGDVFQVHLHGYGLSGRAVRYRILTPSEVDKVELLARGELAVDGNMLDFQAAVAKNGLEHMLVAVSESSVSPQRFRCEPNEDGTKPAPINWRPMSPGELATAWNDLFTSRDTTLLKRLYAREHVVTEADLELIMVGKALVTE